MKTRIRSQPIWKTASSPASMGTRSRWRQITPPESN